MSTRIGVDIGGTFTDGVAFDPVTSEVVIEKVLTTSADLSDGFLAVFDALVARAGVPPEQVRDVMHASTVATNALLERKGARVGLLVTAGFRDVLEIGRQVRSELYNFFTDKPEPLVPRARVYEVSERLDHRGSVVVPLQRADVDRAIDSMRAAGVDSVAICFLHSYRNSVHEQEAAEMARSAFGAHAVSVSSEIAPEIKEYWRASTTCVNAYVGPVVRRYLGRVGEQLNARGFQGQVGIMHSGGGIESARSIVERPFQMIESGPAAGVAGAAFFARSLGYANAISFDMGGTTAKAGLILDGASRVLPEFEVAAAGGSGVGVAKASGHPILGEVVDLVEVGAGGGSLAWIDAGGHLRVGPQGAGSDPGPACYGKGGQRPTITDANLILGRIDPEYFLGGAMALDGAAALRAITAVCADPLEMSAPEAARGVIAIANARMVSALRLVSIERGHDPRELGLVAFGGAGPLHASSLALDMGIPDVLVPPNPGVASAWGLLLSDVKHDVRVTVLTRLDAPHVSEVRGVFDSLSERLERSLESEDGDAADFLSVRYVEARYEGQSSRLRIEWVDAADAEAVVAELTGRFHTEHEREFGYHVQGEPVQILTAGISATATRMRTSGLADSRRDGPSASALKGRRRVVFDDAREATVPVYRRDMLAQGTVTDGPAIIEEFDSSTLVAPGYSFEVLDFGVLRLRWVG
jgi:N-methylhydantoinase A